MLACSLGAIGLIIFTSGTGSLILQACLFGLSFLLSRGLIQQSDEQKTVKSNSKTNIFSIQLEKFFEQKMVESKQINPQ